MAAASSDTKDNLYNAKPPVFDGEKVDDWKDKIKSFFLGFDFERWELVTEGYEEPRNAEGNAIPLSQMTDLQKKTSRTITGTELFCSTPSLILNMRKSLT